MQVLTYPHPRKKIITRFLLTTIISLFVLVSFGQINANKDSSQVNAPVIKVTLLGVLELLNQLWKGLAQVFLFRRVAKI